MQSIIVTTIYLLSIFIPLTFTTINSELFEFPKFILLLSGALVITASWAWHIYQTHDYKIFRPSPISYSLLAIVAIQALATVFSINPYTSFWGYYSRFHQGLLTTICYTIIYFAAVKWLDTKSTQKIIKISVSTAFVVSLYAIAEHFGIDKNLWIQDVQSRVFSTLGQPNWLAAYLIPNLFLTLYLSQTKKLSPLFSMFLFTTLFAALLFTKSRSGTIGFVLAFLTYWVLLAHQFSWAKIKQSLFIYFGLFLLSATIIGTPFFPRLNIIPSDTPPVAITPQGTALENGGTESGDIRKIVWSGTLQLIKKHPLIGTGPETFAYTYYWERPLAHNLTSEWDFLYNKAHNEYLNTAACSGLLGLLAYLYFHYAVFAASLTRLPHSKKITQDKEAELRALYPVLGAAIVGFTLTNFFGFSVIPVYLMMILIVILPTTLLKSTSPPTTYHLPPTTYLLNPLLLLYPARLYLAHLRYAKVKQLFDAGQYAPALPLLQQAAKSRPGLDLYHSALGETYAILGQSDLALRELQTNTRLNPYHLNFFKSRAKIYLTLNQNDSAAAELERARALAPTDPKLAYNLGLVYTRLDRIDLAEKHLRDAISLRPIYSEPYYALTLLYEQTKQVGKIEPLLTSAKSNLATYSAQLKEKIDKYVP